LGIGYWGLRPRFNAESAGYVMITFPDAATAEKAARSHQDAHVATFEDVIYESLYHSRTGDMQSEE